MQITKNQIINLKVTKVTLKIRFFKSVKALLKKINILYVYILYNTFLVKSSVTL
jgi:hypothetical protein